MPEATFLYQHLCHQNTNAVQKSDPKNAFCSPVPRRVYVVSKKRNVANQAPYAEKSNETFFMILE